MGIKEILRFAKERIPPIGPQRDLYRCSAYLTDGTFLPCVILENLNGVVDLAIRRFDETRGAKTGAGMDYRSIVTSFVTKGNTVNSYDLRDIEVSPYAILPERAKEIRGETSMSWTEFTVRMDDGMEFPFGTTYLMEFFEMPEGYSADKIQRIIAHEIGKPGFRPGEAKVKVYREKPYFTCYVDDL